MMIACDVPAKLPCSSFDLTPLSQLVFNAVYRLSSSILFYLYGGRLFGYNFLLSLCITK